MCPRACAARRGKARSADKAQYWELFTTFYRNLIEMPADHLPHTFVEAFAAAFGYTQVSLYMLEGDELPGLAEVSIGHAIVSRARGS